MEINIRYHLVTEPEQSLIISDNTLYEGGSNDDDPDYNGAKDEDEGGE